MGLACSGGTCACPAGQILSGGVCVACGGPGQLCCASGCNAGNSCVGGTCQPCGGPGQPCCANRCNVGNSCVGGTCQPCGATGQPCCANGCNLGNSCGGGKCQCGGVGQACCAPKWTCVNGTVCESDLKCHTCGGLRQECCANNTCNGLTCVPGHPALCICGGIGQACCPGCNPRYTCQSNVCIDPTQPPPQCVGPGGACGTSTGPYCCQGELCDFGTCKTCINHGDVCPPGNQICCSWEDACVLDQFSGNEVCNIRDQGQ
jgi:hypothetical protein